MYHAQLVMTLENSEARVSTYTAAAMAHRTAAFHTYEEASNTIATHLSSAYNAFQKRQDDRLKTIKENEGKLQQRVKEAMSSSLSGGDMSHAQSIVTLDNSVARVSNAITTAMANNTAAFQTIAATLSRACNAVQERQDGRLNASTAAFQTLAATLLSAFYAVGKRQDGLLKRIKDDEKNLQQTVKDAMLGRDDGRVHLGA